MKLTIPIIILVVIVYLIGARFPGIARRIGVA